MLQYVNSFACTVNDNSKNLVINFVQNEPIIPDEDGCPMSIEAHKIISLIMEEDCAKNLANTLAHFYLTDSSNTDIEE